MFLPKNPRTRHLLLLVSAVALIVGWVYRGAVSGTTRQAPSVHTSVAPAAQDAGTDHARSAPVRPHAVDDSAAARSIVGALPEDMTGSRAATPSPRASAAAVALPPVLADAADSLAQSLREGDTRSPPIARDAPRIEPPTPGELADPAAYRRYEARQQGQVYARFEREAVIALGNLDADLQRARAAGLAPELIAEGEEKARVLAATLQALRVKEGEAVDATSR